MNTIAKYVGGAVLAGVGIGVTKLLSNFNVIDPTEDDKIFCERHPGISRHRDLMYGLGIIKEYRGYLRNRQLYPQLVVACERAARSYTYFVRERHNMSENRLLVYPKYMSVQCGNITDLVDTVSLELIAVRPDMEAEVSDAVETLKKTVGNFAFNCQQEVDVIMMENCEC